MKLWFSALIGALGMSLAAIAADAASPPESAIYVTTFVEVVPGSAAQAGTVLRDYRAATRREPGVLESDIYQETGTPSRFVANETWQDLAAYRTHESGPARAALAEKLKPIQFGPVDARVHYAHFIARNNDSPPANSIFVFSHLDVTPPQVPALLELMKPLTENSAKEPGAEVYEII